jgi:hypothetical protein
MKYSLTLLFLFFSHELFACRPIDGNAAESIRVNELNSLYLFIIFLVAVIVTVTLKRTNILLKKQKFIYISLIVLGVHPIFWRSNTGDCGLVLYISSFVISAIFLTIAVLEVYRFVSTRYNKAN